VNQNITVSFHVFLGYIASTLDRLHSRRGASMQAFLCLAWERESGGYATA